eukprot:scpid41776/ scgid0079/ Transcription factor SOX-7
MRRIVQRPVSLASTAEPPLRNPYSIAQSSDAHGHNSAAQAPVGHVQLTQPTINQRQAAPPRSLPAVATLPLQRTTDDHHRPSAGQASGSMSSHYMERYWATRGGKEPKYLELPVGPNGELSARQPLAGFPSPNGSGGPPTHQLSTQAAAVSARRVLSTTGHGQPTNVVVSPAQTAETPEEGNMESSSFATSVAEGTAEDAQASLEGVSDVSTSDPGGEQKKDGRIRRPMNKFLAFAKEKRKELAADNPKMHNSAISKILGKMWKQLSHEDQEKYAVVAKELRHEHMRKHPDYKYKPKRKNKAKKDKQDAAGPSVLDMLNGVDVVTGAPFQQQYQVTPMAPLGYDHHQRQVLGNVLSQPLSLPTQMPFADNLGMEGMQPRHGLHAAWNHTGVSSPHNSAYDGVLERHLRTPSAQPHISSDNAYPARLQPAPVRNGGAAESVPNATSHQQAGMQFLQSTSVHANQSALGGRMLCHTENGVSGGSHVSSSPAQQFPFHMPPSVSNGGLPASSNPSITSKQFTGLVQSGATAGLQTSADWPVPHQQQQLPIPFPPSTTSTGAMPAASAFPPATGGRFAFPELRDSTAVQQESARFPVPAQRKQQLPFGLGLLVSPETNDSNGDLQAPSGGGDSPATGGRPLPFPALSDSTGVSQASIRTPADMQIQRLPLPHRLCFSEAKDLNGILPASGVVVSPDSGRQLPTPTSSVPTNGGLPAAAGNTASILDQQPLEQQLSRAPILTGLLCGLKGRVDSVTNMPAHPNIMGSWTTLQNGAATALTSQTTAGDTDSSASASRASSTIPWLGPSPEMLESQPAPSVMQSPTAYNPALLYTRN